MVMFALTALAFGIAGLHGVRRVLDPGSAHRIAESFADTSFSLPQAAGALLVVFVLVAAGVFVPHSVFSRLSTPAGRGLLAGGAAATAVASVCVFFFPVVWLIWITALFLGITTALLVLQAPHLHRKPWRTAGVAAILLLLTTYAFQIVGGTQAGISGVRWFLLIGAVLLFVSSALAMRAPTGAAGPVTGAFPAGLSGQALRGPTPVARPWACYLLFGVLGAVLALAQPAVADHRFGQAGFAVIICAAFLGWAIGYEAGPTFAPGMSRPRLTSLALLAVGVLTLALGIIEELSGKAVLTALVTFAVGVGVRTQRYDFSRSIGVGAGVVVALLLTMLDLDTVVALSEFASWNISATTVAYSVVGLVALVGGIIALFTFSPHGIQGLGVDLVHAFRTPAVAAERAEVPAASELAAHATEHVAGPGFFIAVEGGDGSGKTTQIQLLDEHLRARGRGPVVLTREPGGTEAGRAIREVVLGGSGVAPRSEALLFAADRAHHVASLVGPALERGETVITDRYIDSSLGYQSAGRELSTEDVAGLSRWATEGLVPHLTLVLDIDPETAAQRTAARGEENHLDREDLAFRRRVQEAFLALASRDPSRYAVIDANRDPAAVAADIAAAVDAHMAARGQQTQTGPGPGAPAGAAGPAGAGGPGAVPAGPGTSAGGPAGAPGAPSGAPAAHGSAVGTSGTAPAAPGIAHSAPGHPGPGTAPTGQAAQQPGPPAPPSSVPAAEEAETTVLGAAPPAGSATAGSDPGEAETTVLPASAPGRSASSATGEDDPTTVLPPAVPGGSAFGEEDATTLLPARHANRSAPGSQQTPEPGAPDLTPHAPRPQSSETARMPVVDPGAGPAAGSSVDGDIDLENAREMPLPQFHQRVSRDRLVAQAELERQARERLRQSRLRRSGREKPRDGRNPNVADPNGRGYTVRGQDRRDQDPRDPNGRGPGGPNGGAR